MTGVEKPKNNMQEHMLKLFGSNNKSEEGESTSATTSPIQQTTPVPPNPFKIPKNNSTPNSYKPVAEIWSPTPFSNNSTPLSDKKSQTKKKISLSLNKKVSPSNKVNLTSCSNTPSHSTPVVDPFVETDNPMVISPKPSSIQTLVKDFSSSMGSNEIKESNHSHSKAQNKRTAPFESHQVTHTNLPDVIPNHLETGYLNQVKQSNPIDTDQNKLLERKKLISDRICDFLYEGKFLPPSEFLKIQNERKQICQSLEQLKLQSLNNNSKIDTIVEPSKFDDSDLVYDLTSGHLNNIKSEIEPTHFESIQDNIPTFNSLTYESNLNFKDNNSNYSNQDSKSESISANSEFTSLSNFDQQSNQFNGTDIDDDLVFMSSDYLNEEDFNNTQMPSSTQSKPTVTSVHYDIPLPEEEVEPEYPWTSDVQQTLRNVFGLTKFRHNQLKAINATLKGEDVFVLMPTGGGKSLCYQLPALIDSGNSRGVTIVISPLLALVQDQVDKLLSLGIYALSLNSDSTSDQKKCFFKDLTSTNPKMRLAYITPEMLIKSSSINEVLNNLYKIGKLARFVIDEAHCVSQWGHDFRPDYKLVGIVKVNYPSIPLIALTATANDQVKMDVKQNLKIPTCLTLTQSFNRKNLYYEVRKKSPRSVIADIHSYIFNHHKDECGIIYCTSRKACEEVSHQLTTTHKLKTIHYHAGLQKNDKQRIQNQWQNGVFHVIVATVAFGMGIDKSNVRFVIHHSLPNSMEGYYQETGRAGRDGHNSDCILYYTYFDKGAIEYMISIGDGDYQTKERQRSNLNRVVQFCENKIDCRRQQILAYFGEHFDRKYCHGSCDNCVASGKTNFISKEITSIAQQLVKIVYITQTQKITIRTLLLLFRGSTSQKARTYQLNSELLGCGKQLSLTDSERLIHDLISKNILMEKHITNGKGFTNSYVFTGRSAKPLLKGDIIINMDFDESLNKSKTKPSKPLKSTPPKSIKNVQPSFSIPSSPTGPIQLSSDNGEDFEDNDYEDLRDQEYRISDYDGEDIETEQSHHQSECISKLKALRNRIHEDTKIPKYKIFSDIAINNISECLPRDLENLKKIEDMPSNTATNYHKEILAIVKNLTNGFQNGYSAPEAQQRPANDYNDDIQILQTRNSHLGGFTRATELATIDLTGGSETRSSTKRSPFFPKSKISLAKDFQCPTSSATQFNTIPAPKRSKPNSSSKS